MIMHNGELYLELPFETQNDPYLAYHAVIQNQSMKSFIPKHIQKIFKSEKQL